MNTSQKGFTKFIILILIIVIGFGLGGWLVYRTGQPELSSGQLPTEGERIQNRVFYIINKGSENIKEYQIEISDNSTVFSLLEELALRESFEIEKTLYPEMGVFVNSIDGFEGGTDNKWWQYWVNGKLSEVAADKKSVEGEDIIEWRFEVPLEF